MRARGPTSCARCRPRSDLMGPPRPVIAAAHRTESGVQDDPRCRLRSDTSPHGQPSKVWLPVVVLLASLLTLLLVTGRTGRGSVANTVDTRGARVRANPVSADAHANISPQRVLAPTPGAAVLDELCGVNGPDLVRNGNETIEQHVSGLTQGAISHRQSALAASEDPRRQAIGLALTNAQPQPTLDSEPSKDTAANNDLVLLAIDTSDPAIYSLALGECRTGEYDMAPGPCQGLSWEHWANIDPDNATPWLGIAAKSNRAGDQQAVEAALGKASTAAQIGAYGSALSALALDALPGDVAQAVAGADVISILRIGTPPRCGGAIPGVTPAAARDFAAIPYWTTTVSSTRFRLHVGVNVPLRARLPQPVGQQIGTEVLGAQFDLRSCLPRLYRM
jgi:hypothetical protein